MLSERQSGVRGLRLCGLLPVLEDIPEKDIVWDRLMCFMDQIRRMGVKPQCKA